MQNGARYIVTTHWGTFSLDAASYQDYLAGKLWISWVPGKPQESREKPEGFVPPNVTDRALSLRTEAEKLGINTTLHQLGVNNTHRFDGSSNNRRYLVANTPFLCLHRFSYRQSFVGHFRLL